MLELAPCWLTRVVIAHHLEGKCAVDRHSSRSQEQMRRPATAVNGWRRNYSEYSTRSRDSTLVAMLGVTCLSLSTIAHLVSQQFISSLNQYRSRTRSYSSGPDQGVENVQGASGRIGTVLKGLGDTAWTQFIHCRWDDTR